MLQNNSLRFLQYLLVTPKNDHLVTIQLNALSQVGMFENFLSDFLNKLLIKLQISEIFHEKQAYLILCLETPRKKANRLIQITSTSRQKTTSGLFIPLVEVLFKTIYQFELKLTVIKHTKRQNMIKLISLSNEKKKHLPQILLY